MNNKTIKKIEETHRAGGVAEVVECLPSKCKVLSSNPTTTKTTTIIIITIIIEETDTEKTHLLHLLPGTFCVKFGSLHATLHCKHLSS
jgi:hypothetical protein